MKTPTPGKPETLRQAQRFDAHVAVYRQKGLCEACSAQMAYGHQLGWAAITPPCESCRPIVNAAGGELLANGWRTMGLGTTGHKWLTAIETRHVSGRVLAVARLIADHADDDGRSQVSRNFVEKASHAGTCYDAAKGLKVLITSGWLVTDIPDDAATRTPRTFKLATPRGSASYDYSLAA